MLLLVHNFRLLLVSCLMAVITVVISGHLEIAIAFTLILFVMTFIPKRIFLSIVLISLLTIVSDLGVVIRAAVQLLSIGSLYLIFFKEYGFDYHLYKTIPKSVFYFVVLLFTAMIISTFMSRYPDASIIYILRSIIFFTVTYMIFSLIRNERDIHMLLGTVTVAGLILTLSIIIEFIYSGSNLISLFAQSYTRSSGLMSSVNAVGGIVANLVPILFTFLFYSKFRFKEKSIISVILFIILFGVMFTSSRASIISIIISLLIVLITIRKNLIKWWCLVVIFFIGLYLVYTPFNDLISLYFRIDEGLSGRELFWNIAVNIIKENPWFGIGPGAYLYEVYNYLPVILKSWHGQVVADLMDLAGGGNSSHNMYLVLFSDMGILGLIVSLLLPVIFYFIAVPLLKLYRNLNEHNYLITASILAMGTGSFIRCLFMEMGVFFYGYITTDLPFWICFGILIYFYQKDILTVRDSFGLVNNYT